MRIPLRGRTAELNRLAAEFFPLLQRKTGEVPGHRILIRISIESAALREGKRQIPPEAWTKRQEAIVTDGYKILQKSLKDVVLGLSTDLTISTG
jgi:hypothetical protein